MSAWEVVVDARFLFAFFMLSWAIAFALARIIDRGKGDKPTTWAEVTNAPTDFGALTIRPRARQSASEAQEADIKRLRAAGKYRECMPMPRPRDVGSMGGDE